MRPLHSLLVVLALLVVALAGWWLLRSNDPAQRIAAAGPAPQAAVADVERPPDDLRDLDPEQRAGRSAESAAARVADSAPASAPGERGGGTALDGRVLDPDGRPIAGARVLISEGSASFLSGTALDSDVAARLFDVRETESDVEGRFRFEGLAADALRVAVRAAGFAPFDAADVPRPSSSRLADIVLERGVMLTGRVVDAAGRAAAGVEVLRIGAASGVFAFGGQAAHVATSAADGTFTVDVLAVGPWSLRFTSERFPEGLLSGRTERPGERVEGLLVQLAEGAAISGRVTGTPPPGGGFERLLVSAAPPRGAGPERAEARSAEVAADGSFTVRGVRAGQGYLLRAVQRDGDLGDVPAEFLPGLSAPVAADAGDAGVVLVLSPEAALTFTVVDAHTGAPLKDFRVEAGIDWPRLVTDDQGRVLQRHPGGRVRVGDLRPRSSGERASLRIEALGYQAYAAAELKLTPGLDTELGTLALEPAPLLTVRVLDDATGAPVAGADVVLATVAPPEAGPSGGMGRTIRASASIGGGGDARMARVDGESRRAETDADGNARLTAFEDRDVRLRVDADGRAPWVGAVHRAPPGAQEQIVRLSRGGTVVVHLFDAAGEPQAGGRVEHRAGHDDGRTPTFDSPRLTNEEGAARFEHLAAGRHRFRRATGESGGVFSSGGNTFAVMVSGMDDGGGDEWVEADVVEGGVHEIEVHLPLEVTVAGRLSEAGEPLADATLSLVEAHAEPAGLPRMAMFGGGPRTTSDADGLWRFEGVEPGEYTLRVEHAERAMPAEVALRVSDADLQRDIDLDLVVLEGRVLDAAGQPLVGVEVWSERARAEGAPRAMRVMAFAGAGGSVMSLDSGGGTARARTDAEGRYVLRGVQSGVELEVCGRGEGLQPARSQPLRLAADEHRRGIDLTLEAAGWIDVEGVFADGSPAAELLITARYEGELRGVEPQTILLDTAGRGRLDGLAPGPWRLSARSIGPASGGQAPTELAVAVAAGTATPATITAP